MKFTSKTEAYLYSIYILKNILSESPSALSHTRIESAISSIKIAIENHTQDPKTVSDILDSLMPFICQKNRPGLSLLSTALLENDYTQSDHLKWKTPLARRVESEMQITLLENPTEKMMLAVKKISDKLLSILNKKNSAFKNKVLNTLEQQFHPIAFGSFQKEPSLSTLEKILSDNNPAELTEIMHIHFKFGRHFSRTLKGENAIMAAKISEIADAKTYNSAYYKERGRPKQAPFDGFDMTKITNQMGLLVDQSDVCATYLPQHRSIWVADAKAQTPNLTSAYVQSLINFDTPYVAGPSGMTAVFIGQAIGFNTLTTAAEKQSYTAAITAYMVSGGFHSLHEVLGPLAFCLPEENLVPGYEASSSDDIHAGKAKPPNFHAFYSNLEKIDSQFSAIRDAAWHKINTFMQDHYISAAKLPCYTTLLNNQEINGISKADFKQMLIIYALLVSKYVWYLQQVVITALEFLNQEKTTEQLGLIIKQDVKKSDDVQKLPEFISRIILSLEKQVLDQVITSLAEKIAKEKLIAPLLERQSLEIDLQPVEVTLNLRP